MLLQFTRFDVLTGCVTHARESRCVAHSKPFSYPEPFLRPCRAPLTARKMGSGYENDSKPIKAPGYEHRIRYTEGRLLRFSYDFPMILA